MDNLLITICARGGSKGVKGKNIRLLAGKPLIYYTIEQARQWGRAKHIIVSTDSEEIAKVAKDSGAEVPFLRPVELATDESGKISAIRHALIASEKKYKEKFNVVMDLDATSPLRKVPDLENAFELFLDKKPKTLLSVVPAHRNPYFNMVELSSDGKAHICKPSEKFTRRQDAPDVYDANASIYLYNRDYLLDENSKTVVSDNSIIYIMDSISRIDIDSELDFKYIEFLVKENIFNLV